MNEDQPPIFPVQFNCPGCGERVEVDADSAGQLVRCPYCNTEFFASEDSLHQHVVDDTEEAERAKQIPSQELDGLKIQQLTALRRGAIRARSWCVITAVVCIVAAIQLTLKAIANVRHERTLGARPIAFILFAVAAVMVGIYFFRKARELKKEIDRPFLEEPTIPPDFSTLSDGSQRWKNLDDVH